jgi:hypothetical protein
VWLNAKTQHAFPHTDSPHTNSTQLATLHPTTAALIGLRANTMVVTKKDRPSQNKTELVAKKPDPPRHMPPCGIEAATTPTV